jgi:hypothetical protein
MAQLNPMGPEESPLGLAETSISEPSCIGRHGQYQDKKQATQWSLGSTCMRWQAGPWAEDETCEGPQPCTFD